MKNYISFQIGTLMMLVVLTITGCAAMSKPLIKSNQNSRQEHVSSHPELSEEIKQAILQAKVVEGMTKGQVVASWGKPSKINEPFTNQFGNYYGESWEYNRLLAIPIYINFENGVVESISDSLK